MTFCRVFRDKGRRRAIFASAALFIAAASAAGCQTTGNGGATKYLAAKYETAVNCARTVVDRHLTPKKESKDEIGTLVRAAIMTCEAPMNDYIRAMFRDVMEKRRWVWMGTDSQNAITREIVLSTSLMLQHEYNEKERNL